MLDVEHGEKRGIINEPKRKLDTIKGRQKRKTPPIPDLESVRAREKDPDSALQLGILAYNITPAELENWISRLNA